MLNINLPFFNSDLTEQVKKDMRASGVVAKIIQVLVGVLAIPEGVIINLATGATSIAQNRLYWVLGLIVVIHVFLIIATLISVTPLPQFIVEFDSIADRLKQAEAETKEYSRFTQTHISAVLATQMSLSALDTRQQSPRKDITVPLEEILKPWTNARTEIFWFQSGLYNFAVYLHDKDKDELTIAYRDCDSRIQKRNRIWLPGKGHVGVCYQQQKVYFSADVSSVGNDNPIRTGEDEDDKNYKAIISVPIFVNGTVKGVFIMTSSEAGQFIQQLHSPIAQVIAILIGQTIKHGWTKEI